MSSYFSCNEEKYGNVVVGVDEVGRGSLIGSVVAAAVVYSNNFPEGIKDSKKIAKKKRESLFKILTNNFEFAIGISDLREIEKYNILGATMIAMERAVDSLKCNMNIDSPDMVLVDGNKIPKWKYNAKAIVKGDSKAISIAAASIVAKVTRDDLIAKLHNEYPQYGWDRNAGYGTKQHLNAIKKYGITPYHRVGYSPIKKVLGR